MTTSKRHTYGSGGRVALSILALTMLTGAPALAGGKQELFDIVRSPALAASPACVANARGHVIIQSFGPAEQMVVNVEGLPPNTDFDFFVIQVPNAPFGMSWYQGDIETNAAGLGSGVYRSVQYRDVCRSTGCRRCTAYV
jgi:hypothetical protein